MIWNCKCVGYEVRQTPQVRTSKKGNDYAAMVVENPYSYRSDQIICRKPETLTGAGLVRGDVIDFDVVVDLSGKYPRFEVPADADVKKHRKSVGGGN